MFSNGIITLTALAVALLSVTGGSVNALVPFFAIGVFTAFAMAGYGMSQTPSHPPRARLASQGGRQLVGGHDVDDRGGDLRGGQVHRRRLAGRRGLPDPGVRL